jgi:hypothetical protein
LLLRKKKHEQIKVSVKVEDYEELGSANKVGFLFFKDLLVKYSIMYIRYVTIFREALHKICRKASINIPLDEEDDFELRNGNTNEVLDNTNTLEHYNIQNQVISLTCHISSYLVHDYFKTKSIGRERNSKHLHRRLSRPQMRKEDQIHIQPQYNRHRTFR